MDYKVVLTARAERDLFEVVSFIARKNPGGGGEDRTILAECGGDAAFPVPSAVRP